VGGIKGFQGWRADNKLLSASSSASSTKF